MRVWIPIAALIVLGGCGKLRGGSTNDEGTSPTSTSGPQGNTPAIAVQNEQPFAGTYTKYAESTFKNGQRVAVTNSRGVATLTIAQGVVTYAQTYTSGGKTSHVTQTYTFAPADVHAVNGGFDVPLVFQKMDADTKSYSPDRNAPKIQARKQATGWQIGLLTTDNNGVSGGVEFK